MKSRSVFIFLLAVSILSVRAAVDFYLEIPDIEGESQKAGREGSIEILSFSWGVSNTGSTSTGAGSGTGKADFKDLVLTKRADKATPLLMLATASGKKYPRAVLTLERSGERPFAYYEVTLEDIVITSYSTSSSAGDDRPIESFSLNYSKVKVEYTPQKADGSADRPVVFTWNLETNTEQ